MSGALKQLGFGFVGPTTMFALMQAIGLINGHSASCFKR
jgi:DNA-3-methyladenine glycosylase I